MPGLPPACPSTGTGSSLKPIYGATSEVMSCWVCGRLLPEVRAVLAKISEERPQLFDLAREQERGPHPFDVRGTEDFPVVLDAALSNPLGLCPRCLRRLSSPCPKPRGR